MITASTHTARKAFRCEDGLCTNVVQAGEEYARHVVFPGDELSSSNRPWAVRICRPCHTRYGAAMPARRTRRRQA